MDYLNASLLNQYWGQIASGVNDFSSKMRSPGLVRPDVISLSVSGQSINATLPTPFGVIFNSGIFATAHGTTNGVDTQNYTVNFVTLFPASGSVTGYVLAEYTQVFQNPEIITGPPPGFPAYNPAFTPSVGYTTNRDSLSLVASTGVANNITSFEIARCVLTAGASAITNLSTQYQVPAGLISTQNYLPLSANTVLSVSGTAGSALSFVSSGVTLTLPPASASVGYVVPFVGNFSSGYSSFTTQGSDLIYGMGGTASGIGTVTVPPMAAGALWSNGFSWQFLENTSNFIPFSWPVSDAPLSPIIYSASNGFSVPTSGSFAGTVVVAQPTASNQAVNLGLPLGGALSGTLPNPSIANNVNLPGAPTAATAPVGTNTTQIATTAFVQSVPHGIQVFLSSGTFTVPEGVAVVHVTCVGGGGGGAICNSQSTTPASTNASGGGGGAGGAAIGMYVVTPGQQIPVTVGLGGGSQTNGGSSSFGSFCSAAGGAGAGFITTATSPGGQGGNGSGQSINITGGYGSDGQNGSFVFAGNGGNSIFGGGGQAGAHGGTIGSAPGAGGGGAYDPFATATTYYGGSGANGIVIVRW